MKKILECKISLMEKDQNFSIDEKGKGNYIVRATGKFKPEEYIQQWSNGEELKPEEYKSFVENALMMIYDNMLERAGEDKLDTVGIWITFDDENIIDNAIDLSVLETMGEYGEDGLIPILEFAKMTLDPYYESSISE
jgi:hypothetical protein